MTYIANWLEQARRDIGALGEERKKAVRKAVTLLRGRMPETGGTIRVEGTDLEVGYDIGSRRSLVILFVRKTTAGNT